MDSIPVPASSRLRWYRVLGVAIVAASTGVTSALAPQYPGWIATAISAANTVIAVLVGKWLGIPIADIVQLALARMTPERAIQVAVDALKSLPPAAAESATRTLLSSIPPEAAARVAVGAGVVWVPPESDRPTPPTPPPPIGRDG